MDQRQQYRYFNKLSTLFPSQGSVVSISIGFQRQIDLKKKTRKRNSFSTYQQLAFQNLLRVAPRVDCKCLRSVSRPVSKSCSALEIPVRLPHCLTPGCLAVDPIPFHHLAADPTVRSASMTLVRQCYRDFGLASPSGDSILVAAVSSSCGLRRQRTFDLVMESRDSWTAVRRRAAGRSLLIRTRVMFTTGGTQHSRLCARHDVTAARNRL